MKRDQNLFGVPSGLVVGFGVAAAAFAWLAWRGAAGDFLTVENRLLAALRDPADVSRGIGPWWLPGVMRDLTALGSTVVLALSTVGVLGYLGLRRMWGAAGFVLGATIGGTGLMSVLKSIFARPRPSVVPHLATEISASFPSGHSMMSSVVYLTLAVLLGRFVARKRERVYFIAVGVSIVGLVGVSRVYLGVHYPTDVAAGWAAGVAWSLLCGMVAMRVRGRDRDGADD